MFLIIFADGDLITIFDSSDLSFAIQCSRILKLQILMNSNAKEDSFLNFNITEVKNQLRNIRDQVNKLLDSLETTMEVNHKSENATELSKSDTQMTDNTVNKVNPSEFDPLQEKNKSSTDMKKEQPQGHGSNAEVPNSQPPSLPGTPGPGQSQIPTAAKQGQLPGEYYTGQPNYGKFLATYVCISSTQIFASGIFLLQRILKCHTGPCLILNSNILTQQRGKLILM